MKRAAVFYWLIGIVIAVIAIAVSFYFDNSVRDFMAQHQSRAMRSFMRYVSLFGNPDPDRFLANVPRRPLFIRRCMCRGAWNYLCRCRLARAAAGGTSNIEHRTSNIDVAEGVRFELTRPFGLPVFKTGAINRSATPPGCSPRR